jgi:hypothetical protein
MTAFHMTCSCGHDIKVDAADRDQAVAKIQSMMDAKAIDAHLKEKQRGRASAERRTGPSDDRAEHSRGVSAETLFVAVVALLTTRSRWLWRGRAAALRPLLGR